MEEVLSYLSTNIKNKLLILLNKENLGFAKGNNYLAQRLAPFYKEILLLNNDTVVPDNTIMSMHEKLKMHCENFFFH